MWKFFSDCRYTCEKCLRSYKHAASLYNHVKYECGKAPVFSCAFCPYRAKRKHCLKDHIRGVHGLDPNIHISNITKSDNQKNFLVNWIISVVVSFNSKKDFWKF